MEIILRLNCNIRHNMKAKGSVVKPYNANIIYNPWTLKNIKEINWVRSKKQHQMNEEILSI